MKFCIPSRSAVHHAGLPAGADQSPASSPTRLWGLVGHRALTSDAQLPSDFSIEVSRRLDDREARRARELVRPRLRRARRDLASHPHSRRCRPCVARGACGDRRPRSARRAAVRAACRPRARSSHRSRRATCGAPRARRRRSARWYAVRVRRRRLGVPGQDRGAVGFSGSRRDRLHGGDRDSELAHRPQRIVRPASRARRRGLRRSPYGQSVGRLRREPRAAERVFGEVCRCSSCKEQDGASCSAIKMALRATFLSVCTSGLALFTRRE